MPGKLEIAETFRVGRDGSRRVGVVVLKAPNLPSVRLGTLFEQDGHMWQVVGVDNFPSSKADAYLVTPISDQAPTIHEGPVVVLT